MLTTLNSYLDYTLKYFGLRDPHDFKHSLKFIGFTNAKGIFPRNEAAYEMYQNIVKASLRKNLPGYYAEKIIYGYHHPPATLDLVIDTLKKSDKPVHHVPIDDHYLQAWNATRIAFAPKKKVRPVHLADMRYYRWNWHPNVEAPFSNDKTLITKVQDAYKAGLLNDGRMSFGNLKNVVFIRLREFIHQIKRGQITKKEHLYPQVTIHTKPALTTTDKTKVRVIAGVSKLHVIPSASRFWPLFREWIEDGNSPMLWGHETILGGMQKLHCSMTIPRLYWQTFVTVDWPAYDLQVNFDERSRCYDCYESYFDFENGYIPTKFYRNSTADPAQLRRLWRWIVDASRLMPLVLPDGSMYVMNENYWFVYSGLFQTQSDDSIINHARILTILSSLGFEINNQVRLKVQGDDSHTSLRVHIPPDQHLNFKKAFREKAIHYFDSEAREEKTAITNSPNGVEILGYTNDNGYPVRDEEKLLAMLLHPRGNPDRSMLMAKCVGFVYASAYKYPNVINVCKTIWDQMISEGITPAHARIQRDVILQGEATFDIPTDRFPTINDVTRHLRNPYVRTLQDKEYYFPAYTEESHFLDMY